MSLSDFNFNVLVLGNFANILMLIGRFVAGIDGSNEITFFFDGYTEHERSHFGLSAASDTAIDINSE